MTGLAAFLRPWSLSIVYIHTGICASVATCVDIVLDVFVLFNGYHIVIPIVVFIVSIISTVVVLFTVLIRFKQ